MQISKTHEAWQEDIHAEYFDAWFKLSLRQLKKQYESYNEVLLFLENKASIKGRKFFDIGCATGELYRYMKEFHPEFQYFGFDISEPAIRRAKEKYKHGNFSLCKEDLSDIITQDLSPSVVFARDVVLHQPDPFEFFLKIIGIADEVAILRLRTRDEGATVLDSELSCQWHYNKWVPYMVLNADECIDKLRQKVNFDKLYIVKNYQQLGGHTGRFLPKECYYTETGTAETAMYIQISKNKVSTPQIIIRDRTDSNPHYSLFDRGYGIMRRKILKI